MPRESFARIACLQTHFSVGADSAASASAVVRVVHPFLIVMESAVGSVEPDSLVKTFAVQMVVVQFVGNQVEV